MRSVGIALACLFLLSPVVASAAGPVDKKTERLFRAKCASCHGPDGKGDTDEGKEMGIQDISNAAWQKGVTDAQIKEVILNGLKRTKAGKQQQMNPMKDSLKPEQVDALTAYVRTLAK